MTNKFSADHIDLLRQSLKYMTLSEDAYNIHFTQAPPGWKIAANSSLAAQWTGGFFARIYEKDGPTAPGEPKYVVAFRGSGDMKDKKNLDADMQIFFRKLPAQYDQGVAFVKEFCEKNNVNPMDIAFTGHSLGGYLAITVGMTLGVHKMWVFNSPGPSKEIRNDLSKRIPGLSKTPCKGLVQIRSVYDVIAQWQYPEGKIVEVQTIGGNHSLSSLKQGIEAAINGQQLPPGPPVKRTVSSVFNEVSKRLTQSGVAGNLLNKIFGRDAPRPPDCDCG